MNYGQKIESLESEIAGLKAEIDELKKNGRSVSSEDSISIVCFSGDWDRLFAAFTIANGALALGQEVHLFFTFWGSTAVKRKSDKENPKRNWMQKMMACMMPSDVHGAPLSKMHFGGLGKWMMKLLLKMKGVEDLPVLIENARELGANFYYCETSLVLLGLNGDNLIHGEDAKWCGVSTFLSTALKGRITMFI